VAHGFATKRCAGSFSVQDVEGCAAAVITLKAAL
jgi:hypothetical protein